MMKLSLGFGLCGVLVACAGDDVLPEEPLARLDLRTAMQTTADVHPVGLAIAPDGTRFVLDEAAGLLRIDGDRVVTVIEASAMPDPGTELQLPFTDLVALGPDRFALTAIGDGFLLDTQTMSMQPYFCYLPDGVPQSLTQRTDAIAFDAEHQRLYAQPRTYDASSNLQSSQISVYDQATGVDVEWHSVDDGVAATGMAVIPGLGLVLGQGARLSRFDLATGTMVPLDDLRRFGVRSIDGLALDPATGALVVVDQQVDAVFELDLARIAL